MGLLNDIFKAASSRLFDMSVSARVDDYRSNFIQYQNMMTQVTMEADKALMTFSIAALAALAALNDAVFRPYGWISFVTLTCFILVVVIVTIGYYVSKELIKDAQRITTANFKKSLTTPLGQGLDRVKFRTLSRVINYASMSLFIVGMMLFIVLMGLYIKGV